LGNCFPLSSKLLDGSNAGYPYRENTAGLILSNGASIIVYLDSANCTLTRGIYTNQCGWVTVDVNGFKPPNMWGKDTYNFMFYSNTIRPFATKEEIGMNSMGVDCSTNGWGCAATYMSQ